MSFDVDFVNIGLDFLLAVTEEMQLKLTFLSCWQAQLWSTPNCSMVSTDSLSRCIIVLKFFTCATFISLCSSVVTWRAVF